MAKLLRSQRPTPPGAADRAQSQGMDQAARALSYLISGVLVWGGLGWLADHLLGTHFLIGVGIVLGAGLGVYLIVVHFGQEARGQEARGQEARGQEARVQDVPGQEAEVVDRSARSGRSTERATRPPDIPPTTPTEITN